MGSCAYLFEAIDLLLVVCRVVLLLVERVQHKIDLGDGDLVEGARPCGAAGTWAGTRTQHTGLQRMGMTNSCLQTL